MRSKGGDGFFTPHPDRRASRWLTKLEDEIDDQAFVAMIRKAKKKNPEWFRHEKFCDAITLELQLRNLSLARELQLNRVFV